MYKVLVEKLERKRPLERPRRRLDNGIRMDLRIGFNWLRIGTGAGLL
jgi:hypothetical protein